MTEIERLQKENAALQKLLQDYYDAALIGAQMEDPTPHDVHDYETRMKTLQERTEQLLNITTVPL